MSSECWKEPCRDGQTEGTGKERQNGKEKEKEGTEVVCGNNQPAESQKQEEPGTEQPLSPDYSDKQEVTSEGRPKQLQGEETQTQGEGMRYSNQRRQRGGKVEYHPQRSKFRGLDGERMRRVEEPQGPGPFFFFGGTNGAEVVSNYCKSRGWRRIYNKHREDFKLKWSEIKRPATYSNFREGEQLVYQIPNNKVLTTKIGLLNSLREYERVSSKVKHGHGHRRMKMEEFIPVTFRMDMRQEREAFFAQQEVLGVSNSETRMWICKPTSLNQGKGISLLKNREDVAAFRLKLQHMEDSQANRKPHQRQAQAYIVQHYIQNPLLLKGRKFDVRSYLLFACTAPYMVFFRHGYVRLTCDVYNPSSKNLSAHLTNQYMQKKNPLYHLLKEDTVWSMESFNNYVNDMFQVAKGLPRDWVLGVFAKRMQQIMTQCFFAVKSKLDCRLGFFDLIGCDFMVDEDFKVWLLEMNCNPALHTNCEVLKKVIPSTVVETLDLTLEIFNKCRLRQRIPPLASQRDFVLLYDGGLSPGSSNAISNRNANSVCVQKTTKSQKTEPRWHKSETEGKRVSLSPANSVTVEERNHSKSGHCPTTSTVTLPLHQNTVSVGRLSYFHSSSKNSHTVRSKNTSPQVVLKMSKCTLHHHLKAADEMNNPEDKDHHVPFITNPE